MDNTKAPVFVCGLGRSGTSWISNSLGQSTELEYIKEAWLLAKLQNLEEWFCMIHDDWADFTPWKQRGVHLEDFLNELSRFYRRMLQRASGGRRFIEKTPEWNVKYFTLLHDLFPEAYYILIYRDGRNYVASNEAKRKRTGEPFDFESYCMRWAMGMDLFGQIMVEKSVKNLRLVRYEDLMESFTEIFVDLCKFVRIRPFTPEPFRPNSAFDTFEHPDDFNNRWRSWSKDKVEIFKRCAGSQLAQWGYAKTAASWE